LIRHADRSSASRYDCGALHLLGSLAYPCGEPLSTLSSRSHDGVKSTQVQTKVSLTRGQAGLRSLIAEFRDPVARLYPPPYGPWVSVARSFRSQRPLTGGRDAERLEPLLACGRHTDLLSFSAPDLRTVSFSSVCHVLRPAVFAVSPHGVCPVSR